MNAMKFFFKTYEKAKRPTVTDELEGQKETKSTADLLESSAGTDGETARSDQLNERNENRGNDK